MLFRSTEKLIEGLKSPEASLMLPDLLSMADPFGSSVEDTRDGKGKEHLPLAHYSTDTAGHSWPKYGFANYCFKKYHFLKC